MSDLTITEVAQAKNRFQSELLALMRKFEEENGVRFESIDFMRVNAISLAPDAGLLLLVDVKIYIP
jgi:hypothetical protein